MSARNWSIRSRLIAVLLVPLVTLTALWGFTVYITLGSGLNLYHVNALGAVAEKGETALRAVQAERRDSVIYLADRQASHAPLDKARTDTDTAVAAFRSAVGTGGVQGAASPRLRQLMSDELAALDQLKGYRAKVDARQLARGTAIDDFSVPIDGMYRTYDAVSSVDDPTIASQATALIAVSRGREMLSREDAVLAGAIAAGRFTGDDLPRYAQLVGAARYQLADSVAKLPDSDQRAYQKQVGGTGPFGSLRQLEDTVLANGRTGQRPPVSGATWTSAASPVLVSIGRFELTAADQLLASAKPVAYTVIGRIVVAGLLGLLAVVLSVLLSVRTARRLIHQLRELRDSARAIAGEHLPSVVERLRRGEDVDVAAEVPPLEFGDDEIGEVGQAFNAVQQTAVRSAVDQSELAAGFSNVFLNIARRSQALLQRQLGYLDVMERKADEPDDLEDLFRIDHLATRMRRNAENLVILGGSQPVRQWAKPVPMLDVLRSAASEVEEYQRVQVLPVGDVVLAGSVVSDVVHLLAELMDNATAYSPGHAKVHVSGQLVPRGFAVEIEDRGRGLSAEELSAANKWLRDPPEFNVLALAENARLGMFVVSRIAGRHDIRVSLRGSPYGGTTAIVLLPTDLVAEASAADELARRDAAEVKAGGRRPRTPDPEEPELGPAWAARRPQLATATGAPGHGGPGQEGPGHGGASQPDPALPDWVARDQAGRRGDGGDGRDDLFGRPAAVAARPADPTRPSDSPLWSDAGRSGDAAVTGELSRIHDAPATGELGRIHDASATGELGRIRDASATGEIGVIRDGAATGEMSRIRDDGSRFGDGGLGENGPAEGGPEEPVRLDPLGRPGRPTWPDRQDDDGWPRLGALPPPRPRGVGGAHRAPANLDDQFPPATNPATNPSTSPAASAGPGSGYGQPAQPSQPHQPGYAGGGFVGSGGIPRERPPSTVQPGETHLGLPKRVRQASLMPELREDPRRPSPRPSPTPVRERTPEEIRRMMSSYQRGTMEGRTLARQEPQLPTRPDPDTGTGTGTGPGRPAEDGEAAVVPQKVEGQADGAAAEPADRSLPSTSAPSTSAPSVDSTPTETFPKIPSIPSIQSGEEG